jgi:DNA-binding NarL/FixJ family response regulator
MPRIRILIADDHALLRDGLRAVLAGSEDLEVVGEARDGAEAIAACRRLHPDVVLMDVAMPVLGGLEATPAILKDDPRCRVLVLTQYGDREYVTRMLRLGASGYVLKSAAASDLAAAVRAVHRGGLALDPAVARDAVEGRAGGGNAEDPYEALTDRERQVLKLVAEGRSNKEVADVLGVSVKTAMSHRAHLMEKVGAHGRADLVRFAVKHGVVRVD